MNKIITTLFRHPCAHGINRAFKVFFAPDANKDNLEIGMTFTIMSVNRQTGEVRFVLDYEGECRPVAMKEKTDY